MSIKAEKTALRARMREVRDAISGAERAQASAEVAERLLRALGPRSKTVMIFLSFGSEIPTDPICERLADAGHQLAVPHIEGGEVIPVEYRPGEDLVEAVWGIREPADERRIDPKDVDVVVAPGLAFDRSGSRVGYGGGFYDRLLTRTGKDCIRIGIGFHAQLVESVPHGPGDRPLELILTETETIACR